MQVQMFGHQAPSFDPKFQRARTIPLGSTAWVEHAPGWVSGHATLCDSLRSTTRWRSGSRKMYERVVAVPRLIARLPDDGPGSPVLPTLSRALSDRYQRVLSSISMALYRDGRDSVAMHNDRLGEHRLDDAVVAIVSLGGPRRFLLKPKAGGPSMRFKLGWGDLLVMGGDCQRHWDHGVPKVSNAEPRISLMFREAS
jgi:alkylated DNA repair dioxygenase AlkB